ncbi:MAG: cell division protein FtsZ [Paludibacteraceae bacterium]|nr:cell division protein FtsZ [Paludibacteraceae bacterium]
MNSTINIDVPISEKVESPSIIKVMGIGGGGGNAVNNMFRLGIKDVSFAVCNTDYQALKASPVPCKIRIGDLGAGSDPKEAERAALANENSIREALDDGTKMLFITATMGGGTGTGASPIVARIAQELGILTVGIVTIPFAFEGEDKIIQALKGVDALSEYVDALLLINNEKLLELYKGIPVSEAFKKADEVLSNAAKSIAEIITINGYINVDFADVYTTLKNGNIAIMNVGQASGENRVTKALDNALYSPLVSSNDIKGAKKILFNLYCSHSAEIMPEEFSEIHEFMRKVGGKGIKVIWGITFDDELGESVKVTLIATGYEMTEIPGMPIKIFGKRNPEESRINDEADEAIDLTRGVNNATATADDEPQPVDGNDNKQPVTDNENKEKDYANAIQEFYGKSTTTGVPFSASGGDTIDLTSLSQEDIENIPAWKRKRN